MIKKVKVGDEVWSDYFNEWVRVARIVSDAEWYFTLPGHHREERARTPLSWFERQLNE